MAVNKAAYEYYGYTPEEISRMTVLDLRPEEDRPRLLELIRRMPDRLMGYYLGAWRHLRKDGSILDVDVIAHGTKLMGRSCRVVMAMEQNEKERYSTAS
jgi:PAS domain S-box-containing protein